MDLKMLHFKVKGASAFTLVELLVVVAIIVVLIALLLPAMEKSVYQAELAVCMAQMKGICNGASAYAVEYNRSYPYRKVTDLHREQPYTLAKTQDPNGWQDDRPTMRSHIPISLVADPLSPKVKLDVEDTPGASWVHSGMSLYFGVTFVGYHGMRKLGDVFEFTDSNNRAGRYSLLVADFDWNSTTDRHISGHPDKDSVMSPVFSPSGFVTSRFENAEYDGRTRGLLDLNYGYTNGSVVRYNDVAISDPRMGTLPYQVDGLAYPSAWVQVPRE